MITLGFKKKHKRINLPKYQTLGASGMDVCADILSEDINEPYQKFIGPYQIVKIDTGLYPEIPEGYELQVRSRSGLALKEGLSVLNAPGTIDSDFKGEIGIIIKNNSKKERIIEHGQKIAQLVFSKVDKPSFIEEINELTETERSDQSYGSTGK